MVNPHYGNYFLLLLTSVLASLPAASMCVAWAPVVRDARRSFYLEPPTTDVVLLSL